MSEALDHGEEIHEVSRLAQRIRRGEYNDGAAKKELLKPDFSEPVPVGRRKRSRKRGPLSIGNKIDIVYRMLINFEKQAEVAREFRVSPQVVAHLMMKAKKNKQFLQELIDARGLLDHQRETIKQTVDFLNQSRSIIDSAKDVATKVNTVVEAPVTE